MRKLVAALMLALAACSAADDPDAQFQRDLAGAKDKAQALVILASSWFAPHYPKILELALAQRWPWLALVGEVLHWFNTALFLLLAVPWLTRWVRFREAAMQTLKHPVQANFYPTFSIALLVLAAQWLAFTPCVEVAITFWWLGVVLHFIFSSWPGDWSGSVPRAWLTMASLSRTSGGRWRCCSIITCCAGYRISPAAFPRGATRGFTPRWCC